MTELDTTKLKVKLTGKNGNTFNLIGVCLRAMRKARCSELQRKQFVSEVTASHSYDAALAVMGKWFDLR